MEFFKLIPIVVIALMSIRYFTEENDIYVRLSYLFFFSIVSFSQNFFFHFREFHQIIQIFICFCAFYHIIFIRTIPKVIIYPIVFYFFVFLSIIFNTLDSDSLSQIINFTVVFFVLCILYLGASTKQNLIKVLNYTLMCGVVSSVFGVVEFIFQNERVNGTFANPNYYALFLGVVFALNHYLSKNRFKYVASMIIILSIIFTGSRSALLIPVLCIIIDIVKSKDYLRKIITLIGLFFFVLMVALSGTSRFGGDAASGSDAERLAFGKVAIEMANDNKYTGVGWGRFITRFQSYAEQTESFEFKGIVMDISHQERRVTHNDLLRILSELGYIALLFTLVFLARVGWIFSTRFSQTPTWIIAIWCGMIIFSLTHNNLNTAFSWYFLLMPFHLRYINFYSKDPK